MLQNLSYYIFIENYLKYVIWLKFEALCWVKKFNTSSKYLKCCVPTHIYWYNLKSILLMHSINNSYGLQLQKNISKMLFYSLGNNYINENIIENDRRPYILETIILHLFFLVEKSLHFENLMLCTRYEIFLPASLGMWKSW